MKISQWLETCPSVSSGFIHSVVSWVLRQGHRAMDGSTTSMAQTGALAFMSTIRLWSPHKQM